MLAEEKKTNGLYAIKVLKKEFIIDNDEVERLVTFFCAKGPSDGVNQYAVGETGFLGSCTRTTSFLVGIALLFPD